MITSHLVVAAAGFVCYVHFVTDRQWNVDANIFMAFLTVMVGACLPDIDHPDSTVGKRVLWLSYPIRLVFGHRGITHSFIAVAAIGYLAYQFDSPYISWLALGYLLHLVGDYLTDSGIPLLYPYTRRYRFLLVGKTNGASEYLMVAFSLVAAIAFIEFY
ncbi:metal-dependent hydrolase [Rheinheimera hassiensis]|uniref:metal-dependent hydrolase n=1 Tax=Rheinheimera hassiensis TaxID=1193627 RepID=UPI001F06504F|nr:metal-dependent hydrolase [Rheinheimera hassiensis]